MSYPPLSITQEEDSETASLLSAAFGLGWVSAKEAHLPELPQALARHPGAIGSALKRHADGGVTPMAIRVILVDDHQMVLEGLKGLLAADPEIEVIAEATSGKDAVELAAQLSPDVMILDITMPGLNGIETMRQIRLHSPETEAVGPSMHAAGQVVCDMLRAGASGYILKTASVEQLGTAIRTVMTGETFLSDEIADLVPTELLRGSRATPPKRVLPGQEIRELTQREREVLKLVTEGKSSKEIANALFVTTKTIVFHRQSIMDKLDLRTVAELTKYAVRMGLTSL